MGESLRGQETSSLPPFLTPPSMLSPFSSARRAMLRSTHLEFTDVETEGLPPRKRDVEWR